MFCIGKVFQAANGQKYVNSEITATTLEEVVNIRRFSLFVDSRNIHIVDSGKTKTIQGKNGKTFKVYFIVETIGYYESFLDFVDNSLNV